MNSTAAEHIHGYTLGTAAVPRSPLTLQELEQLKQAILFTQEDIQALRLSHDVVKDQVEPILDVWYGFVASLPHLVASFAGSDGKPHADYLAAVRKRFGQWILDTASANYDQAWLDYQQEIGLRHHRRGKNRTDAVKAAAIVPFRYIPALIYPVTATLRPFLTKKGHSEADVDRMQQAWIKSVLLQVILWSHPYIKDGDF